MKKILFFNTTKLAVALKRTLMVLTLCIISALCIQAEESTTEPSDSIAMTGPKKSHWLTETNIFVTTIKTYHNQTDYAQVKAVVKIYDGDNKDITSSTPNIGQVTLENISTQNKEIGIVDGSSLLGNETTPAYINWNSSKAVEKADGQMLDTKIAAAHKLKVKFTAECIHDDYNFVGWYKAEGMSDSDFKEGAASFSEIICIGGGNEPGAGYGSYVDKANKKQTYTTDNRYTVTYYACFQPKANVTVTLKAAENGTYTYTDGTNSGTITSTDGSIETKSGVTLQASPATGYKFFGWYEIKDGKETYFSYESSTEKTFKTDATISAKFIPEDWATYVVRDNLNVQYYNFQAAANAADASTDKVFLPLVSGVIPNGNYTIPSGVTLLIPYEATYKNSTNEPEVTSGTTKPTKYRQLTLASGCVIDVEGAVCVNAKMTDNQHTNGATWGASGIINMSEGAKIVLKKNTSAKLYCWGAIVGTGEIVAESSSTVYEAFQSNHYPGGTFLLAKLSSLSSNKIFPMQIYCIPNIQARLKICYGAEEKLASAYATTGVGLQKDIVFITKKGAESGLFKLADEESYVEKWYDRQNDKFCYNLYGGADMEGITIKIASVGNINSTSFVLPMTHNMLIELHPLGEQESTVNITSDIALLPSSKVTVKKNVVVNVNKALYVYDSEEWKKAYAFGVANKSVIYDPSKTTSFDALVDAVLEVDGTIQVEGGLYTTQSAADICSNGSGKIKYINAVGTMPNLMQMKQTSSTAGETEAITITAAQLHNDESKTWNEGYEYTLTAGSEAGDEYVYNSTLGRWRCERTVTWDANGGEVSPTSTIVGRNEPLSLYFTDLPTPTRIGYTFNGWNTEADGTGSAVTIETTVTDSITYYAQWTFAQVGDPLDIVDADGTNLTINANGWASSGWPYTVSVVTTTTNTNSYEKTARQSDRTLKVPYSGDLNADMQIIVTNTSGTVSNHIYKVPFVYTGTEDMSAMNENSIVFVKSDTLSIEGIASAKEIYVAPGAALQVNENGILDVKKLVLRTTPFDAAILTNKGTIVGQVYYSRIARDTYFHLFAIPAGSNTADVVLSDGTSAAKASTVAPYGNAWQLREYNTARRAEKGDDGANWNNIGVNADKITYSDVAIEASKGYELRSGSKYYREYLFPVTLPTTATSVQVTDTISEVGAAAGAAHAGWNIICSPYTYIYTAVYKDPARGIKVSWQKQELDGSYSYIQEQPTQIKPAVPFAYQTKEDGSLYFSADSLFFKAPRKQSAAEALTETEWIHLDIFDAYGEGDETSLFVHPTRFDQTYKTGIDMAKQSLTAPRPIIYSTHAYGDMAFAGVADSLLENGIDIAVYSPAAQELTFSLRENKFLNRLEYLWLADNETGERTDLLMDDYTFRADAGTAKGRFVLNGRFKAPQISTGIGNTQTDYNIYAIGNNIAISGVEQGTPIYVFDAVGHMIYTTAATSDEVIVPAPCAGVYMLTIGGQTAKLVINK